MMNGRSLRLEMVLLQLMANLISIRPQRPSKGLGRASEGSGRASVVTLREEDFMKKLF